MPGSVQVERRPLIGKVGGDPPDALRHVAPQPQGQVRLGAIAAGYDGTVTALLGLLGGAAANAQRGNPVVCTALTRAFRCLLERLGHLSPNGPNAKEDDELVRRIFERLTTVGRLSPIVCVVGLYYVNYVFAAGGPTLRMYPGAHPRLLVVCVMLAHKMLADHAYTNRTWSRLTGLSSADLCRLEIEVLGKMRYRLAVTREQYERWLGEIERLCGSPHL